MKSSTAPTARTGHGNLAYRAASISATALAASASRRWNRGALYRDVPELGPLVDLAIPLRVLSHDISVRGNGCWPESPAGGMLLGMLGTIGPELLQNAQRREDTSPPLFSLVTIN
jgi:hypothetical protein